MTYADAMRRFGSDKPDLRFGLELVDLTSYFADTPFRVFQAEHVGAVVMPGGADQPRRTFDAWQEWAKQRGARGLAYVTFGLGRRARWTGRQEPVRRRAGRPGRGRRSRSQATAPSSRPGSKSRGPGAAGRRAARGRRPVRPHRRVRVVVRVGRRRADVRGGRARRRRQAGLDRRAPPVHLAQRRVGRHASSPRPGEALAWAYDIVCNGNEIGGGSIRIHRGDVQQRVFDLLGLSREEAQEKFGFLLEAFTYGPPPHGGIAFGWDRICMLLAGAASLTRGHRVPEDRGGFDPLTGAPTPITPVQRKEAGIDFTPPPPDPDRCPAPSLIME